MFRRDLRWEILEVRCSGVDREALYVKDVQLCILHRAEEIQTFRVQGGDRLEADRWLGILYLAKSGRPSRRTDAWRTTIFSSVGSTCASVVTYPDRDCIYVNAPNQYLLVFFSSRTRNGAQRSLAPSPRPEPKPWRYLRPRMQTGILKALLPSDSTFWQSSNPICESDSCEPRTTLPPSLAYTRFSLPTLV